MTEALRSILLGTAGLTGAAAVALLATLARGGVQADDTRLRSAIRLALLTIVIQASHFGEEFATGFQRRFPQLLGLAPWSDGFFLVYNLAWLAIWAVSIPGLARRHHVALFPLWFLAIAGIVNGLAHPLLSLRTSGYFPGLFTSPLIGIAGLLLFRALLAITDGRRGP
ncbi:MAG TPA: hypothetical protein VFS20_15260 [Longimicrobium sp.]|nr:hypothetical protein [Longimicrobium sp.]